MSRQAEPLPRIMRHTLGETQRRLLAWYEREGRSFPWRLSGREMPGTVGVPIHDPYETLICEVMLQQTQTSRVVAQLPEFLALFPDVGSLAVAGRGELLRAWQGMGYNRRALRLQAAAVAVVERFGGRIPGTVDELTTLPGIGLYTASAVACFAFGAEVPVVDVNVVRVLSRLFFRCHTADIVMPEKGVRRVAAAAIPNGDGYRWHQGLMDLGATICTARVPSCETCPLQEVCLSAFPMKIALFNAGMSKKIEPMFRGEPRRIWRGRIVQLLRSHHSGRSVADIAGEVTGEGFLADEETTFLSILEGLLKDGLVVRSGVVSEPGARCLATDIIRLPD